MMMMMDLFLIAMITIMVFVTWTLKYLVDINNDCDKNGCDTWKPWLWVMVMLFTDWFLVAAPSPITSW